jgi:hypothetical protein
MGLVGMVQPRNSSRGLMQIMSGDGESASRHFDSSSSTNLWGTVGMTADFSVAGRFCLKALPNVKGNKSKQ